MTYNDLRIVIKARLYIENFNMEHLKMYEIHIKMLYIYLENSFILDELHPHDIDPHIELLVRYITDYERSNTPSNQKSLLWTA